MALEQLKTFENEAEFRLTSISLPSTLDSYEIASILNQNHILKEENQRLKQINIKLLIEINDVKIEHKNLKIDHDKLKTDHDKLSEIVIKHENMQQDNGKHFCS